MRAFLQRIHKIGQGEVQRIFTCIHGEKTRVVIREFVLVAASVLTGWGGWSLVQIAIGKSEGFAENVLSDTLPLLISGVVYIDRFAAVFGVVLAGAVLLTLLERSRGALWRGITAFVIVFGVISASTPFTLVAWMVLAMAVLARNIPQKSRIEFLFSMGAVALSILVLSGGAFLAEMTMVATVSSQLPPESVLFALILLFGGSLGSIRSLSGAYLLIPAYVALRLCLFFLGTASASFLTIVALIAILAATHEVLARRSVHVFGRASLFLLFMCIPLTMMSVELQVITAVQCFLFGGIAIATSGVLADTAVRWPLMAKRGGAFVTRFGQSPLPGTLLGGGSILVGAGFFSLAGETSGVFETLYIILLVGLTLGTLLCLSRLLLQKEVVSGSGVQLSGPVQALLLLGGGVGFAHILAYLGTTIGGASPDATIAIAFAQKTLTIIPWLCALVSAVIIALLFVLQKQRPEVWRRVQGGGERVFGIIDTRFAQMQGGEMVHRMYRQVEEAFHAAFLRMENRILRMTLQESGILILVYFIVTLIVLF